MPAPPTPPTPSAAQARLGPTLLELQGLFQSLNWNISDPLSLQSYAFNRFCELFLLLDGREQRMVLEISKELLWIDVAKYHSTFARAFGNIPRARLAAARTIYVLPLCAFKDEKKDKSGNMLVKMVNNPMFLALPPFAGYRMRFICQSSCSVVKSWGPNPLIILADDFIGSGNQASGAVQDFVLPNSMGPANVIVLALVAQKAGQERLREEGFELYAAEVREKGISGRFPPQTELYYIGLMQAIEQRMGVDAKYKFGFGSVEALVRMSDTPNSTFPLYWFRRGKPPAKGVHPAPLPRASS